MVDMQAPCPGGAGQGVRLEASRRSVALHSQYLAARKGSSAVTPTLDPAAYPILSAHVGAWWCRT